MIQEALLIAAISTSSPDPTKQALVDTLAALGNDREYVTEALRTIEIDTSIPKYFRLSNNKTITRSFANRYERYKQRKGYHAYQETLEDFVDKYETTLIKEEIRTGVDYRALAATLIHETLGGIFTATHGVLESLYTQYAKIPRKKHGRFGAINQANYLFKLARKLSIPAQEIATIRGSYAAAIGMGQFMPENLYYHYPANNIEDFYKAENAIRAVANYYQNYQEEIVTPILWQEELNLSETMTLEWKGNSKEEMITGFLAYNKSAFYALMSYELTSSIPRNHERVARLTRKKQQEDVKYKTVVRCKNNYTQIADTCNYFVDVNKRLREDHIQNILRSHQITRASTQLLR